MTAPQPQKRRVARIPVACSVGIRDKAASWITQTVDVGARGCRISLERPLSRGSLVQLYFDRGSGNPLEALGQVAWTRTISPRAAGIVFVNVPREPTTGVQARNWIDALVATRLRQVLIAWPAENGSLSKLADVALHLGVPPLEPLEHDEMTLVRIARDGVRLGTLTRTPEVLATLVSLLEREVLSVARETPDPEGWKAAFGRLARAGAAPAQPLTPAPRPR